MASDDLHDYIHAVLDGDDQGPHRHIMVDKDTLNDAIDKHTTRIGMSFPWKINIFTCVR